MSGSIAVIPSVSDMGVQLENSNLPTNQSTTTNKNNTRMEQPTNASPSRKHTGNFFISPKLKSNNKRLEKMLYSPMKNVNINVNVNEMEMNSSNNSSTVSKFPILDWQPRKVTIKIGKRYEYLAFI